MASAYKRSVSLYRTKLRHFDELFPLTHLGENLLVISPLTASKWVPPRGWWLHTKTPLLRHNPPAQNWINTFWFVHAKLKKRINDSSYTLNLIHNGYKNILVRTIDTDVLVLLISHIGRVELGDVDIHAYLINSEIYYGIRAIIQELESNICRALPFLYALSGCDTVSSFYGKGKCKAYDVSLKSSQKDDLTEVFIKLGETPAEVTPNMMNVLESYVLDLYGSKHTTLGAARLDKFNKSTTNDLRSLPASKEALCQHVLRASYQAGYLWWQSVEERKIPDPEKWSWKLDSMGILSQPLWTTVTVTVKDFTMICSCKTGKCKTCKCASNNLSCLFMCDCSRSCQA